MCILFLLIGDDTNPTIVCNNRDEYLARATVRGSLIQEGNTYCPVDQVGGGSWLSFSGLNESRLKFAIVLNYHFWRQANVLPLTNEELLKSRGLLIKDFMENSVDSLVYAENVYNTRAEYRPFNLVVGDHTGCYYISSDLRQTGPRCLERGKTYGISNGYIEDHWQKVATGVEVLTRNILPAFLPSVKSEGKIRAFADCLMTSLLQLDTPLEDPDLGNESEAITILGAIFVNPCLILKRRSASITAHEKTGGVPSSSSSGGACNDGTSPSQEVSTDDETIQQMHRRAKEEVLKYCQVLPKGYSLGSTSEQFAEVPRDCIFSTRTSTVFIYCPPGMNHQMEKNPETVFRPTKQLSSRFCIIENDLDGVTGEWSTNCFSR